jgi:mycothiol synthase
MGEIFVIGVRPDRHGERLGRNITVAGLDHLARRGFDVGMLYVESDNVPARRLYESLGFRPDHEDVAYEL